MAKSRFCGFWALFASTAIAKSQAAILEWRYRLRDNTSDLILPGKCPAL
jgi:hypothetical protein